MAEIGNITNAETSAGNVKVIADVEKTSGNYQIIDSGIAITFSMKDGISFKVNMNIEDNTDPFSLTVKLNFETDNAAKERRLKFATDERENILEVKCINFEPLGAGTSKPIKIANYRGSGIYMHFWVYELGGTAGRKIEYCFYAE